MICIILTSVSVVTFGPCSVRILNGSCKVSFTLSLVIIVTLCIYIIRNVSVTTRASVCCIALCLTSGSCNCFYITVSVCCNFFISCVTASCTCYIFIPTDFCTSGCFCSRCLEIVVIGINYCLKCI